MDNLSPKHNYRSPKRRISWFARMAPTWTFYAKIMLIVLKASRLSKRGMYTGERWTKSSVQALKALESVGVNFEVENIEAFQNLEAPCVFVGNHMSILETFILPCLIQPYRNVTFVVKQSLIEYPFFKHVMISRDPVVVGRINPVKDLKNVLKEGQKRLSKNMSIVIFPQTTRSVSFNTKKFNTMGIKLAKRSGVPIIPIALKTDAWGLGRHSKDFGKINPVKSVHICFGDPLCVRGNGREEHNFIIEFIKNKLELWR